MTTRTEGLKQGVAAAAESATNAAGDLADKARSQAGTAVSEAKERLAEHKASRRGRSLLIGAVLVGAAATAYRYLRGRLRRKPDERVIDLTQDPVVAPESLATG